MLTEMKADGLCSRPMSPLELDQDGVLWFFVRTQAGQKTGPYPVNLAFSQPDDAAYLSVTGDASVVHDQRKIDSLWSATARLWISDGPSDPELALLRVHIRSASCWDAPSNSMLRLVPPQTGAIRTADWTRS